MTQIEKIRQEIERLKEEQLTRNSIGVITGSGVFVNATSLLSFLDTLQEPEFPTTDEEMEAFLASHPKVEVPDKYKTPDWLYKELKQEPEVDLEKAAREYAKIPGKAQHEWYDGGKLEGFKAGAKWALKQK